MSARLAGLMALPTSSLIVAVKAAGMAPQGTKVMDAKALDTGNGAERLEGGAHERAALPRHAQRTPDARHVLLERAPLACVRHRALHAQARLQLLQLGNQSRMRTLVAAGGAEKATKVVGGRGAVGRHVRLPDHLRLQIIESAHEGEEWVARR